MSTSGGVASGTVDQMRFCTTAYLVRVRVRVEVRGERLGLGLRG